MHLWEALDGRVGNYKCRLGTAGRQPGRYRSAVQDAALWGYGGWKQSCTTRSLFFHRVPWHGVTKPYKFIWFRDTMPRNPMKKQGSGGAGLFPSTVAPQGGILHRRTIPPGLPSGGAQAALVVPDSPI